MSSVKNFFEDLSGVQQDIFLSVVSELQTSAPNDKIERLEQFYKNLKAEIDRINYRREALGRQASGIESILNAMNKRSDIESADLEFMTFKYSLSKILNDIRVEIDTLKPEKKLAKKFDVARRLEGLKQRRDLSERVYEDVLKPADTQGSDCNRLRSENEYIETITPED